MSTLTKEEARQLLINYHFKESSLKGVFDRLGSIQMDPLNPVGRNVDLVIQSRVKDYHVDDWLKLAYKDRYVYDAWDKKACLVLSRDWPYRRIYHKWHGVAWHNYVFKNHKKEVKKVLEELRRRGPLGSQDFEFQIHKDEWKGSWYGPKLTKVILRALWHTGVVLTHSRKNGNHIYDFAENIIPQKYFEARRPTDKESIEWLVKLRHKAVGLLRLNANADVWSMDVSPKVRREVIEKLVKKGELIKINIEGIVYHCLPEFLETEITKNERAIFVAPLDQIMWDRKMIKEIFGFEYLWEVYVPEAKRKWGYYVLPVIYGDKFIARFDSRLVKDTWHIYKWLWEDDVKKTPEMLNAIKMAMERFKNYLGAKKIRRASSRLPSRKFTS